MALPQKQSYTAEDYWNLPEDIRAELIDGQIYNMAPPSRLHQKLVGELYTILNNYIKCDPKKLTDRGCSGAPDWIIEIVSPGNPSHDFIYKLNLYAKYGVREYWIVDPRSQTVLVYYFEQKDFGVKVYTFQDAIKVNIYDDFWIDFQNLDL